MASVLCIIIKFRVPQKQQISSCLHFDKNSVSQSTVLLQTAILIRIRSNLICFYPTSSVFSSVCEYLLHVCRKSDTINMQFNYFSQSCCKKHHGEERALSLTQCASKHMHKKYKRLRHNPLHKAALTVAIRTIYINMKYCPLQKASKFVIRL